MILVADFRTRFPEFADIALFTDARIQLMIDEAVILMADEVRWLDWYELAQNYLVAHLLTLANATESGDGEARFPLKKQDVDDVLIESAVNKVAADISPLFTTTYGQSYYRYLRMTFTGIYGV